MTAAEVRRFSGEDLAGIERLVSAVALECYGHLLPGYRFDAGDNWPAAWVAAAGGEIVGVMLTGQDWLDDLWIARRHRRAGLGTRLLRLGEDEIAGRGHAAARLRVVAENTAAQRFYARHGWSEDRRYPHEIHGFEMVEMAERLDRQHRKGSP